MQLRIHLLVSDAKGPIPSAPGGSTFKVGKPASKYAVACDPAIILGDWNRGTTEPWAVRCEECRKTEAYKKIDRPKPNAADVPNESVP